VLRMLKIERLANGQTVFALTGRMNEEHILELQELLGAEPAGNAIVLDLKGLTLAGQNEIEFFAKCEERGIALAHCPPYIREWVTRQRLKK